MDTSRSIEERLAPCGLHCGKCFAFAGGDIQTSSRQLRQALGDFAPYARRFRELLDQPVFDRYPDFEQFLGYLSEVTCRGCRQESCKLFRGCNVRTCAAEKGVDFCYRCAEFPCAKTGFDPHLYRRFVAINERMRAIGPERYYEEIREKPRY